MNDAVEQVSGILRSFYHAKNEKADFRPGVDPVRIAEPMIDHEEIVAAVESLMLGWLGRSWRAALLERRLAELLGVPGVRLTNSGSSANLIAVHAMASLGGMSPGDEVITTALTFPTTIGAILNARLKPVLVDSSPQTYTLQAEQLTRALSSRTKGILAVHVLGNPVDMDKVLTFARAHGLFVIEDACDALGATFNQKCVGSFGDCSSFSFYASHHITTGEGGAIAYQDDRIGQRIIAMAEWGREPISSKFDQLQEAHSRDRFPNSSDPYLDRYDRKFTYVSRGFNVKITEIAAAIGLVQLSKLDAFARIRKDNFEYLSNSLRDLQTVLELPTSNHGAAPAWLFCPILLRPSVSRNGLVQYLEDHRIETRPVLAGNILRQPGYLGIPHRTVGTLDNTDLIMKQSLCVGIHPGLTHAHLDYVACTIRTYIDEHC
jgi:CDP-4-dehydro-6-deoxyglucose reductase, E1